MAERKMNGKWAVMICVGLLSCICGEGCSDRSGLDPSTKRMYMAWQGFAESDAKYEVRPSLVNAVKDANESELSQATEFVLRALSSEAVGKSAVPEGFVLELARAIAIRCFRDGNKERIASLLSVYCMELLGGIPLECRAVQEMSPIGDPRNLLVILDAAALAKDEDVKEALLQVMQRCMKPHVSRDGSVEFVVKIRQWLLVNKDSAKINPRYCEKMLAGVESEPLLMMK